MNANLNASPTTEPAAAPETALGVWLYAVTGGQAGNAGDAGGPVDMPPGVAGEPVRRIDASGLTAVVGTVDLAEFGEEALRRKLEDLDWLAAAARAHDHVVNAVAQAGPTVPVGLATVFSGDDTVRALLDVRCADFVRALRHLAGRSEWGVKAYADSSAIPKAESGGGVGAGAAASGYGAESGSGSERARESESVSEQSPGAGTAFLKRRRAQLAEQQSAAKNSAERADSIHARLTRLSAGSRRYAPQNPVLTGRRDRMLLNGAYLVDDGRISAFHSAVAAIDAEVRRAGVRVEVTGPWPSYSFTAEGLADG